ncbi:hypothetical protein INR49_020963 [Caranx melampygus]|nr:hypothetical protein INR49_020963 [Caranx melampygus]
MVKDHLNNPVNGVPVKLVEQHLYRQNMPHGLNFCSVVSATSQVDGRAPFICNTPGKAVKVELKFQTADPSLQAASQASLPLTAVAYQSTNERYIYIDPPLPYDSLEVGRQAQIKVYSATPSYIPVRTLSYLVLSKGKVVHADSQNFLSTYDNQQTVRFTVTSSMVPSIRLLVYYILYGEGTSELVADSVWMDVKASCVNGLKTNLTVDSRTYRPKENLQLDIKTNHDGLLALSAVDTGLFTLRPNYRDPVSMVLRHIEHSDLGCDDVCTALVRPRRALTDADRRGKVNTYRTPFLRRCCENGMKHMPKSVTCQQLALQSIRKTTPAAQDCKNAFTACCLFAQEKLDEDDSLILGRNELGVDFDQTPVMVRSHFPESWLWEAYPISRGVKTVRKPLPDSLTTWDIKAISMSSTGAGHSASQYRRASALSADPGEQVELSGSVYNQLSTPIKFCVTLTAPSGVCLLRSHPTPGRDGLRSTSCNQMLTLHGGGVRRVTFTVLGLEPGEHTLTFTLKTLKRGGDIVEKKLRVVPEGVRKELLSGGTLDPGSVYGWPRKTVHLQNILPANVVPGSVVKRQVMVHGETLGEVMAVIHSDDGLRQLFNTPAGSADWELDRLLILIHMFQYLEKTNNWSAIGGNTAKIQLQTKISQALVSVSSFKRPDSSYSRWRNGESSTWLTAQLVNALSLADHIPRVQSESAAKSIDWLFTNAQILGGAFIETSTHQPKKITNALNVKSVYVRAVAAYALTLHDPRSQGASSLMMSLENSAIQRVYGPPSVRYWQESGSAGGWVAPDQSSGLTVEMTAYVLQTGRIQYAKPIMAWLTHDQNYGEALYSPQDTVLTLAALTAYSAATTQRVLNQQVSIRYGKSKYGTLGRPHLTQSMSVATPIEVTKDDDIIVSTDSGTGVATVKMKTVFYQTMASIQNCNFEFNIEMVGERTSPGNHLSLHLSLYLCFLPVHI